MYHSDRTYLLKLTQYNILKLTRYYTFILFILFLFYFLTSSQLLYAFYDARCHEFGAEHKKNCNGNTLDYDFPMVKSKLEVINIDPFNQQYRVSSDGCYFPCVFMIFKGICDSITGTSCVTWSDYGDAVFKIGSGDVGSIDTESGIEILSCSNLDKSSFREVNNSINATLCIANADMLFDMYGGYCKYNVCHNIKKEKDAEKNKEKVLINKDNEEGVLFICAYATRSGFLSFTAASNRDLIGCIPQPLKPSPPILNDVIVSGNTPYVEELPQFMPQSFDKPSLILKRSENDLGIVLTHDMNEYYTVPMKGSQKIIEIKSVSGKNIRNNSICSRFGDSSRYYCAVANNNGQICAYLGQNSDDVRSGNIRISNKLPNCFDPDDIIGCIDRPPMSKKTSSIIIPYYQVFVSNDNSRYPSVVLLEITGIDSLESVIGKDLDNDDIGIFMNSGSGAKYYKLYKKPDSNVANKDRNLRQIANCDILASAISVSRGNNNINNISYNTTSDKSRTFNTFGFTINHKYKDKGACILKDGVNVNVLDVVHQDIIGKSCSNDSSQKYNNDLCPKKKENRMLIRESYKDVKNMIYLKSQALISKYNLLVDVIIPEMGKGDSIKDPVYVKKVQTQSNTNNKKCSTYRVDTSDFNAGIKNRLYLQGGYRDREYCYCSNDSNNTGSMCPICSKDFDSIAERAVCAGSFPKEILKYYEDVKYKSLQEDKQKSKNSPEEVVLDDLPSNICIMPSYGHWNFISEKPNVNMICTDLRIDCSSTTDISKNSGNAIWPTEAKFGEIKSGKCPDGYMRMVSEYSLAPFDELRYFLSNDMQFMTKDAQNSLDRLWYNKETGSKARNRGYITILEAESHPVLSLYIKNKKLKCRYQNPVGRCISGIFAEIKYPCVKIEYNNPFEQPVICSEK